MDRLSAREASRLWLLQHEFVYRDEVDTLEDSPRLALLTAAKGAREERERLRLRTVNELNCARSPQASRVRGGSPIADVCFIVGIVLVIAAVAVTFVTAGGDYFDRTDGAPIWFGCAALLGVALLAWCDPLRARGEIFYSGTSTGLHFILALLLLGVTAAALVMNASEIDAYTIPVVVLSGALFVGSAVWCLWMWWRGRGASDLDTLPLRRMTGPPDGMLRRLDAGRGLIDRADEPALYAVLDEWWQTRAAEIERAQPGRIEGVWRTILQHSLEESALPKQRRALLTRALETGMRVTWKERRYDWSPR